MGVVGWKTKVADARSTGPRRRSETITAAPADEPRGERAHRRAHRAPETGHGARGRHVSGGRSGRQRVLV